MSFLLPAGMSICWNVNLVLTLYSTVSAMSDTEVEIGDNAENTSNENLILQITSQQEEINTQSLELQCLRTLVAEQERKLRNQDATDDRTAAATRLLQICASASSSVTAHRTTSTFSRPLHLSQTLAMPHLTPVRDPPAPGLQLTDSSGTGLQPLSHLASPSPSMTGVGDSIHSNDPVDTGVEQSEPVSKKTKLDEKFEKNLEAKYKDVGPKGSEDLQCDPIPPLLAETLSVWFRSIFTNEEIRSKLLEARRPSNADALKPILINKEVYKSLSREEKEKDRPLKCIANAVCKGSQSIVLAWSKLLHTETVLQDEYKDPGPVHIPLPDGSKFPLTECIQNLDLALQLLGIANVQISQKRRYDLCYKLAISAKDLAGKSQPFTGNMFGDNIKEDHAEAIKNYQLTKSVVRPKHRKSSFHGQNRSHSGGRSSHHQRSRLNPLAKSECLAVLLNLQNQLST